MTIKSDKNWGLDNFNLKYVSNYNNVVRKALDHM